MWFFFLGICSEVNQLVFRKNLSDWMESKRKDMTGANNEASKFIIGMEGYLKTTENFDHSMTPTLVSIAIYSKLEFYKADPCGASLLIFLFWKFLASGRNIPGQSSS